MGHLEFMNVWITSTIELAPSIKASSDTVYNTEEPCDLQNQKFSFFFASKLEM